jgi:hypothetical protein
MRLQFFDNKSIASQLTKKTRLAACLALVALAATLARADQTGRRTDDSTARRIPGLCLCCGKSCTCLHCGGCCDPCLPQPRPKPVPLPGPSGPCPWPQAYPWLKAPLTGQGL